MSHAYFSGMSTQGILCVCVCMRAVFALDDPLFRCSVLCTQSCVGESCGPRLGHKEALSHHCFFLCGQGNLEGGRVQNQKGLKHGAGCSPLKAPVS